MSKITEISGRKIIDSRGEPTVEVKVTTEGGFLSIDSVPSGTSTGIVRISAEYDFPCGSSESERVTPPPRAPSITRLIAWTLGSS